MTGLLERARRAGYDALSLSVEKDSPAVSLYERYGFRRVGEEDDALTMVAKLGSADGL
jgi:ribosomal protein S18 acetylase RimI-like enzyme